MALCEDGKSWERRVGELLLGAHREGRAKQPRNPDLGKAVSGGGIYLSFPGLRGRLAARTAGEIGVYIEQSDTPNALQRYAGTAPVTRRSGRSELAIARRLAHDRYLEAAVH